VHRDLLAVLAIAPRDHVTIINTQQDKPFTVNGFGQRVRDAITAAGLPLECQPHGLRKAAGRRLAEARCTAHEIMAVLGHKTLTEAERYTREADQARPCYRGIGEAERTKRERTCPNRLRRFGQRAKNRRRINVNKHRLMADAGAVEPVSASHLPANREINRENCRLCRESTLRLANTSSKLSRLGRNSLKTETGNFISRSGIFLRRTKGTPSGRSAANRGNSKEAAR